jgi:L,D-peptidoglycan transpeptidase YkuD (ErfK/YbiS/YcfS/YnhG family)
MRARRRKSRPGPTRQIRLITVLSEPRDRRRGLVCCGALRFPCALGRGGIAHLKREGDGATPAGRYRLLCLFYRRDRQFRPPSALPMRVLRRYDAWCEDPRHGRYNRPLRLPSRSASDAMWREDHLYDVVGVLDWNVTRRTAGKGSAIFLHLARPGYAPTAGCIALDRRHLVLLLAAAGPRPEFAVAEKPRKLGTSGRRSLFASRRSGVLSSGDRGHAH